MKYFANRKRIERTLEIGDLVYLKLQPYTQHSVELRRKLKLSSKFYGPFQIIKNIGEVAYKLNLPVRSRIHHVFHAYAQKKIGDNHVQLNLLTLGPEDQIHIAPETVLKRRAIIWNNQSISQVLMQ